MVLVAWMVFAIVVIYLICSCIKFCVKQVTKDKPVQIKTLVKRANTKIKQVAIFAKVLFIVKIMEAICKSIVTDAGDKQSLAARHMSRYHLV